MNRFRRITWLLGSLFVMASAQPALSLAAGVPYDALVLSVTVPKTLKPGQAATAVIQFKNIGTGTWKNSGSNFVSLYRYDASRRVETTSLFSTPAWETDKRALRLPTDSLSPGQWINFWVPIRAPSVAGAYREEFILAAENAAWLKNSKFTLEVTVAGSGSVSAAPTMAAPVASASVTHSAQTLPTSSEWSAELVDRGGSEWQIAMEENVLVTLAFKNTGSKTWTREGSSYVSLYATDPNRKERASAFKDAIWTTASQAVRLKETTVKPGEIGHFSAYLRAPLSPGTYQETFTLAAENTAWIQGSTVTLPIRVPMTASFIAKAAPEQPQYTFPVSPTADGAYLATLLLRSAKELVLSGNGRQDFMLGFKNTGTATWNWRGLRVQSVQPMISSKISTVRDESWVSTSEPVRQSNVVRPGEIGFLNFKIKAPPKKGTYTASFQLVADDKAVDGGLIDIPITVTADGYLEPEPTPTKPSSAPTQPASTQANPNNQYPGVQAVPLGGDTSSLPNEPIIRVGLFKTTDDKMVIRAMTVAVNVTSNGQAVCRLAPGDSATASYDRSNRVYRITGGSCSGQSSSLYVFRTEDGSSPMEIADFSRPVGWLPGANDNTFRTHLELRYTPSTDSVWIINELPIESYLRGIAETSNISPQEYQRALLTAARTYAMYHVQRGTKHANENYTVDAKYDQVYRGYGSEARSPNIVMAVNATRGQIVTHGGKLAITPYYSRSDGRTRSWTEVWGGGSYAWLVSVPVPWDNGRTLWGHGVGMSATGALGMANDGKRYDEILKHFYTGIELRQAYK